MIRICDSAALVDGGPGVRFPVRVGAEDATGFAVRHGGRVFAYLNECAHVAMELDWLPGVFFDDEGTVLMCATHGAAYAPDTGRCVGGPCAGRGGLLPIAVVEHDGGVYWMPGGRVQPPAHD